MNRCLITIGACAALATSVTAQSDDVIVDGRIITAGADFDGDGANDIVITDPATGHFTVGFGGTHPDFVWWPVARALPTGGLDGSLINYTGLEAPTGSPGIQAFDPAFRGGVRVAVGDVNGDGADDYIITSVRHPAVYVLPGSTTRANALTTFEKHPLGAGPSGLALAHLDASTPGPELAVPLLAELQPRTVEVRPQRAWSMGGAGLDILIGNTGADRYMDFALLAPGPNTNGGRHNGHIGGYVFKTETGSRLRLARFSSTGPATNILQSEPWTHLVSTDMRGPNGPGQFVLWSEGLNSLNIVTVQPAAAGDDLPTEEVAFYYNSIAFVYSISRAAGDLVAVGHSDGTRISLLGWDGGTNRFGAVQELTAPPGRRFTSAAATRRGMLALLDDGSFANHEFNAAGQLVPTGQGALPAMPAKGGYATVMLYSDDPLGGGAFEFESFLTGDWTGNASYAGGKISVVGEIFQSTALGLGDPMNVLLTPSASPGPAAQAQGNQFGDASSSIFYAGGVGADGNAAVQISPGSGSYGTAIHVKFTPAVTGTTVIYRVNGQPWQQSGAGGFFLAADAVVEYYGQSAGGALGAIHSAHYTISPQFAADANGDGLPDALAASLGLDPAGDGDTDDDGVSDVNEILNSGDPRNANSQPAALNVTLPPSLEVSLSVQEPSGTGPLNDRASPWMRVSMMTTGGSMVRRNLVMTNGGGSFRVDAALLPTARANEPGLSDFGRALIAEVELPGTDPEARGASLFGMAFAPGFVLPQQPAGETPSLAQWIAGTTAAVGGASGGIWKTTNFLTTDTGPMLINADTTLAVAAFSAWTADRLREAGVTDANFAWDHRGSRGELSGHELVHVQQQLRALEQTADATSAAWDLGAVARSFYIAIATGPAYAPLRTAARDMMRRDLQRTAGSSDRVHNAAQALLHFFDTGELEPFYAASVTQSMAVLTTLRAQLLGLPQPRSTRTGVGILRSTDGGQTWTLQTADGEIIALLDDRSIATMTVNGVALSRRPASDGSIPLWLTVCARNDTLTEVRVFGFALPDTETRPPGTDSAMVPLSLEALGFDFRGDLNDIDGDRLDDSFEMRHFSTLAHGFDDDTDSDGYTNGEEYFLFGNPAQSATVPAGPRAIPHNLVSLPGNEVFTLAWDGRDDVRYSVEESTDLGSWGKSPVAPRETAPGRYEWSHPGSSARRFVRIVTEFEK